MAQYDYRCKSCHSVTTVERSMSDPEGTISCSACGSNEVVRIYGSVSMLGVRSSSNLDKEPFSGTTAFGSGCGGGSCPGGACGLN